MIEEYTSFRFGVEFQEVSEELPIKGPLEDEQHLHLTSPHQKRFSRIHHMPLNESFDNEELTVHIPGGTTEEISIHTEYAPPGPRLSWVDDDSRLVVESEAQADQNTQDATNNSMQEQSQRVNN